MTLGIPTTIQWGSQKKTNRGLHQINLLKNRIATGICFLFYHNNNSFWTPSSWGIELWRRFLTLLLEEKNQVWGNVQEHGRLAVYVPLVFYIWNLNTKSFLTELVSDALGYVAERFPALCYMHADPQTSEEVGASKTITLTMTAPNLESMTKYFHLNFL